MNDNEHNVGHLQLLATYQQIFELRPSLRYIDARQTADINFHRVFRLGSGDSDALVRVIDQREVLEWRSWI